MLGTRLSPVQILVCSFGGDGHAHLFFQPISKSFAFSANQWDILKIRKRKTQQKPKANFNSFGSWPVEFLMSFS